jgi:hypothetical protein
MKKIAKLLKADFNESSDLASIAAMLASKGRGKDTILAHITPREAQLLKDMGGSGTTNPDTGLLEFEPTDGGFDTGGFEGLTQQQVDTATPVQSSGEIAAQQFPDYGPTQAPTTSAGLPFSTGGEQVYAPIQAPAQTPVTPSGVPYVATSADRAALFGEGGYGAKASPTEIEAYAPEKTDFLGNLKQFATPEMARLGLAGAGALLGSQRAKQAAQAGQAGKAEMQALATPYQQTGAQVQAQAQRGELTPVGQQSLQAMQARLAQGVEARGGVGAQQAAAQLEAMRQSLLQQQMDYGLKISGIGDNIAMGAIRTGLQADQAVNQLTNSMYSNMLYLASGMYPGAGRTTERA